MTWSRFQLCSILMFEESLADSFLLRNCLAFVDGEWKPVDILTEAGRIARIEDAGSGLFARFSLEGRGLYVSPGWVDLHVHLYPLRKGGCGTRESRIGIATGVTALLDAGTVGASDFEDFRKLVLGQSQTPVYCLLNIKSRGIRFWSMGRVHAGEDNIEQMQEVSARYPETIRGVKVTASSEHMAQEDPMYYVRKALEAGKRLKLPVMVHFGRTPPELEEILPLMRPGDMLTHCFRDGGHHILDERGGIRSSVLAAGSRGVNFDVGHGVKSFSFKTLEAALAQGFLDFSISSDLYILSVPFRARSFGHVLSKFLAAGMSLEQVMARASEKPAGWLGLERGLGEGRPAEMTIFRLRPGDYKFKDCWGLLRRGKELIEPVMVISGGKLYRL